ncbi:hypothetical protein [Terrabacter carboxydivorans]|uniref:Aldo/keto reductase n=1 Tax=Terrabacter carboxydivorans TaxID=619730 RepID=A0ABP5ZMP1_9MICO
MTYEWSGTQAIRLVGFGLSSVRSPGAGAVDQLIPGIGRIERLEDLAAVQLELTADDLAELDSASARVQGVQVQGDRYPEAMQRMVDR